MLENSKDMETFLRLVEANATVKQYKNELGFNGGDVRVHIKFIEYYRVYLKMAEEISILTRSKKDAGPLQRTKLEMEIRRVRTKYRSLLLQAKAGM